ADRCDGGQLLQVAHPRGDQEPAGVRRRRVGRTGFQLVRRAVPRPAGGRGTRACRWWSYPAVIGKVAVVSDIQANKQALEATLEAVAESEAAELWCLGDLVGYGADPDACVELAREHAAVCLAGNHDMAVTGELSLEEFSRGASVAAQWTR